MNNSESIFSNDFETFTTGHGVELNYKCESRKTELVGDYELVTNGIVFWSPVDDTYGYVEVYSDTFENQQIEIQLAFQNGEFEPTSRVHFDNVFDINENESQYTITGCAIPVNEITEFRYRTQVNTWQNSLGLDWWHTGGGCTAAVWCQNVDDEDAHVVYVTDYRCDVTAPGIGTTRVDVGLYKGEQGDQIAFHENLTLPEAHRVIRELQKQARSAK